MRYYIDFAQLAVTGLAFAAMVTGSFTVLALAVVAGTFELKFRFRGRS